MVTITGKTFLRELQVGLHGFLKKRFEQILFSEDAKALQCTGSSAAIASLVFIKTQSFREQAVFNAHCNICKTSNCQTRKQDGLCHNQKSVINAFQGLWPSVTLD